MSDIKLCFPSRFKNGVLMQFDYSQLEVRVLAYLSDDTQLKADLKAGIDMHCMSAQFLTNIPYPVVRDKYLAGDADITAIRKNAKACSFLTQYGGGVTALARGTGLPKADCKRFITNYYDRYEMVQAWQNKVMDIVKKNARPSSLVSKEHQLKQSWIGSRTGRIYTFTEQEAPDFLKAKGINFSFSPTQAKNYPVQGLATGDIVPMMLGRLNRWLYKNYPTVRLVNTIHDSIILDVPKKVDNFVLAEKVKDLLETAPRALKEVFGIEFDIELPVDVEVGESWGDMLTMTWLKIS